MINVSNEFIRLMGTRTDFKQNAEITFADGTFLELKEKDFTVSNNSITDSSETNGIPLGVAVCRTIQIELMNDDDRFSDYDFFGAKIRLYLTFQLSETIERIEYGTFTVLTPETYGTSVIITALDDMYKADVAYETTLPFPSTIGAMFRDACNTIGISQGTTTFLNDDFVVQEKPEDVTFRQVIGYISMIAGGNARIDRTGRLKIITYNFGALDEIRNNIDGGSFAPWDNPVDLDGGDFTYNTGDVADGGSFLDAISYHILVSWKDLKVDTDDIVITGVSTEYTDANNEQHIVMNGVDGYVLKINNPLITGNEQNAVALIGNVMVGGRFRQFSGDLVANPTCEFMDALAIVDRKNNVYVSFVTDINFQFFGFTNLKNSAEPALRNSAKTYSDATKTLVAARQLIKNERTAREQAVAQLAKDLANSSGLFITVETQADGSSIYYMHDKSTLAESMIVWKLTALAFGISTDGGKTYPYGFTVDGTTITRLLYAEGIDADYIDTGAIRIVDSSGNTLFLADYDSKQVSIDANNVHIGSKKVQSYIDTSKIEAIDSANEDTDGKLKSYSTTVEMQTAIDVSAEQIELSASKTYETKSDASNQYEELSSKITVNAKQIELEVVRSTSQDNSLRASISANASEIAAEVSRASTVEGNLATRISQSAEQISLRVEKNNVISEINQTAEQITIKAERIDLVGLVEADELVTKFATINTLNATKATLENLIADKASIGSLNATNIEVENLKTSKLSVDQFTAENISAMSIKVKAANVTGVLSASQLDVEGIINSNTFKGAAITVQALYALAGITVNGVACSWKVVTIAGTKIKYLGGELEEGE